MALPAFSAQFAARAVSYIRGAVAFAGGQREAARFLDLPISTLRQALTSETWRPQVGTIERLGETFRGMPGELRWQLLSGADYFETLDLPASRRAIAEAAFDPEGYLGTLGVVEKRFVQDREGRERRGEPPLESGSP